MKIFAINGSPRKNGKTQWALEQTLEALKTVDSSIETELISLAGKKISGCISCGKCRNTFGCSIKDDFIESLEKLKCPDMVGLQDPPYTWAV
jgi:multimeric flavodoxin WrbA